MATGNEPVSAANLKAVVDKLKEELGGGVVLFSSSDFVSSGTLSDSVANYDTIEVHVRDGDSNYDPGSSCIYKVTGESFVCYMYAGNTRTKLNFNGTSFSRGSGDPRVSRVIGYR